ncbi:MAG: CRISPR-associated exonuclease Cas4 [Acidimicrobiaceae bacterium]|nr:CRISPR-associated exonuclease Cas4 [Acidimicrobiaceae bacterium]
MAESEVRPRPPDEAARRRIVDDLAETLFVEAGAGSGKTTALVNRVVALVVTGEAELRSIAAITFTEKAATELRDRIRQALAEEVKGHADESARQRCREALEELDSAAIGTLHAFAQRLLSEHPVEAALPPRVDVLDEVTSSVEFERRWASFRDQLLADPALERPLLLLMATGVKPDALRSLALAFDQSWDLVIERVPKDEADPPPVADMLEQALAAVDEVCAARASCHNATDLLCVRLEEIAEYASRLRALDGELDILEALGSDASPKPPSFSVGSRGRRDSWGPDLPDLQKRVRAAGDELDAVREAVSRACAHRVGAAIRRFTVGAAAERRAAGRLEFHDLLVMARSLLRDPIHGPAVRTTLHRRYQRLLLDEFQDTDPIQIELAVRIAAAHPEATDAGRGEWADVAVTPGQLFVVGDPKQSIYRFRRADISTFLTARDRFGAEGGGVVELTANFRTVRPVIDWVNVTFAALMAEEPEIDVPVPSQPDYVALDAVRAAPPQGPPVAILGRHHHGKGTGADALRAAEAADVVATVTRAITEAWSVDDGTGGWRGARLGDVTVLVPARTSLPFLEDALEGAGIPFRAESSSLVYASRAVRDLLTVLRAVDDPTDHLRTVAALRTPLLACGDDDLFRFRVERRGRWSFLADQPDTVPAGDPVGVGLAYLASLHQQRHWRAPSELLDSIARDRRALELGVAEGRPRDVWRRLRFVIDQARAWHEATGGSLRQYLRWVEQQTAEGARVAESVLPETDDDAVRIMTIHAAKGLEFPITIVSGLSTAPQSRRPPAEVFFPPTGGVGYRFGRHVMTEVFADWLPIDEQMGFDERIRLLYVACTRARDHLVVSLHRKVRAGEPKKSASRTNAELLLSGMGPLVDELPDGPSPDAVPLALPPSPRPAPPPRFEAWAAERSAALAARARPTAVAATALTDEGGPDGGDTGGGDSGGDTGGGDTFADDTEVDPGLAKRPRDLDLPPWLKGRYGTAVGRAVHGVLQTIDLATGAGLADAVAAQCEAEAVPERAADVRRLVQAALQSKAVREAAAGAHWREVYACTPMADGRLLEGYVDLLYRRADGLVVVDHKTAHRSDPALLDLRMAGYRLQGASYAVAVATATGEPVVQVTFLFLTPDGAIERDLPNLDQAVVDVRNRFAVA